MLEVKSLQFGYTKDKDVFSDVSFTIGEGEFIAIGGCNGSGKTTITRLLVGLEKPKSGHIIYKGQDITQAPPSERGQYIGYVFQQPDRQMFRPTVVQEVAFGPETMGLSSDDTRRVVESALERTGIGPLAGQYPPTLRRGDKQRVAIASALAMNPQILILDEPTSGQDGREKRELIELLEALNKEGVTILLITHDMEIMAAHCKRAIIMGNQTKAFDGTPEELFTNHSDQELLAMGLTRPACVSLSASIPGFGYCASMDEFTASMIEKIGK